MPTDQYGLSARTVYYTADVQIGGSVWSDAMPTFSTVPAYLDGATLLPGPNQIFPNAIVTFYPRTTTSSGTFYSGTGGWYCVFCSIDGSDGGFRGTSASESALTTAGFSDSGDSVFSDDSSTKCMEIVYKDVATTISFKMPSVSSYVTVVCTWKQTEDSSYASMDLSAIGDAVDLFTTWPAVTYAAGSLSELAVGDGSVMSVSGAAGAAGATDDGSGSGSESGAFGAAAVSVGDDGSIVTPHADGSTAVVSNGGHAITLTGADDSTSTTDGGALSTSTGALSIGVATGTDAGGSAFGSGASTVALTVTKTTADGISTIASVAANGKTIASVAADGTTMHVDHDATQLAAGDVHLSLTVDGPDRCEDPVDQCEDVEKKSHSTLSTEPVVAPPEEHLIIIYTTGKDIETYADLVQGIVRREGKVVSRHTGAIKVP
jgi:hypothetical protein